MEQLRALAFMFLRLYEQASVIAFRCGLSPEEIARLGGPAEWDCRDVMFTLAHLSVQDLPSALRDDGVTPAQLLFARAEIFADDRLEVVFDEEEIRLAAKPSKRHRLVVVGCTLAWPVGQVP